MAASIKPNWITMKIIDLDANIYSEINLLTENLVMLLHPHRILDGLLVLRPTQRLMDVLRSRGHANYTS